MESFFLAETTKYLYLLFDTDNFIHNQGQHGTVIETPHGECVIDAGGYIFNTEAHPIDPGALHCCSEIPNLHLYDINKLDSNKKLFRGDSIDTRRHRMHEVEKQRSNKENKDVKSDVIENSHPVRETTREQKIENNYKADDEIENNEDFPTPEKIQTITNIDTNENESQKEFQDQDDQLFDNSFKILPEFVNNYLNQNVRPKFDPQLMLERLRADKKYSHNTTWENNYQLLSCEAQPFLQKISILGEFFNS